MQQPMFYSSGGLIGKLGEPETRVLVSEWTQFQPPNSRFPLVLTTLVLNFVVIGTQFPAVIICDRKNNTFSFARGSRMEGT